MSEKVDENRLRRAAKRQGYMLQKSRRRDPRAIDYGQYRILDPRINAVVIGDGFNMSLEEVDYWLSNA